MVEAIIGNVNHLGNSESLHSCAVLVLRSLKPSQNFQAHEARKPRPSCEPLAITNNRLLSIEGGDATFKYRDRSEENKVKALTLNATEFIRRYLLHILPRGFMKIRYFGFLGHANKKVSIPLLRLLMDPEAKIAVKLAETVQVMMMRLTGVDLSLCPECGKGKMIYIEDLPNLLRDTS